MASVVIYCTWYCTTVVVMRVYSRTQYSTLNHDDVYCTNRITSHELS